MIYLDYNATTPLLPEIQTKYPEWQELFWGNPSSVHHIGQKARTQLDEARSQIAQLINAERPESIVFTSGGTESNNLALKGLAWQYRHRGKHIIVSSIEHHSVLFPARWLAEQGFSVTEVPALPNGQIDMESLKSSLVDETFLIALMGVNNETGVILPLDEIAEIVRQNDLLFHIDAVQMPGKLPIDVQKWSCSSLSLSSHKMYGPKGAGCLYLRESLKLTPLFHGGPQEKNFRAGTQPLIPALGMGLAASLLPSYGREHLPRLEKLRNQMEGWIGDNIPDVFINGKESPRIVSTSNISFPGCRAEDLVIALDLEGVCVSTGSACTSGAIEASHVLQAMNLPEERVTSALRISLGYFTTETEIDQFLSILRKIVERLRS